MAKLLVCLAVFVCAVMCKPLDNINDLESPAQAAGAVHALQKRFIDSSQTFGSFRRTGLSRLRTKRELQEDCEKLELCKLHARSNSNFLAAFELYFVNKENAQLWDHKARSISECYRRFSGCERR